ncbi:MAG: FAD-dependent oxidoreductase, partial [Polymorphobacter sp.]
LARWLVERIDAAPTAALHFGHRVTGYTQDAGGARVAVVGPDGSFEVAADFLIGADGAGSAVRAVMGCGFEGFTYAEKFLCLTTAEPLETHLPGLAPVNYVSDPDEWAVLLRVPSLWRVLVPAAPADADDWLLSDAKKAALFDGLIGKPDVATAHRTIYRVQQRVAERFVDGRVAIIGDAAHLNSPLGGFGMNSGIHDAFNLAARLASVRRCADHATALAAFEHDRRSITLAFVQAQTIANMEMIGAGTAAAHALRRARMARLMTDAPARRAFLLRQSMLDTALAA